MIKAARRFFASHQFTTVALFGLLLASIRFLPFYFGQTIFFGDNYSLMVPGKLFTAMWLKQGVLPLWNPYIFAGLPWIGDINQSVLYPSTLLFIALPTAIALNWLIILHYVLTAIGMYLLSKLFLKQSWQQFLATGLWTLSTQIAGSTNNFSTLQSLAWLPWVLWAGWFVTKHRAARILFAFLVLLQFLGGYPQHVIFSIVYAVILSVVQKRKRFWDIGWLLHWVETGIYTLLISAVAWIPFVDDLLHSTRMEQSAQQAQVGSLDPVMLIKPFAPYFFDHSVIGMKWGPAWNGQPNMVFVITLFGMLVLGWSLLQWKKWNRWTWLFAGTTLFTTIFSLGENLPGYLLIQQLIPLFRVGRYPSMLLIVGSVTVILWFVQTLENFSLSKRWYQVLVVLSAVAMLGSALLYLANWLYLDQLWHGLDTVLRHKLSLSLFHTIAKDAVILRVISASVFATMISSLAALWLFKRKSYWLLVIVLLAEMLFSTQGMFIFGSQSIYPNLSQVPAVQQTVPPEILSGNTRVLTRNGNQPYTDYGSYWEALVVRKPFSDSFIDQKELTSHTILQQLTYRFTPDWNMVFGVPTIHGYTTLLPQDFAHLWNKSGETRINFIDQINPANPLLAEWAVGHYIIDDWFFVPEDLSMYPTEYNNNDLIIKKFPDAVPRFRFSSGDEIEELQIDENPNKIELEFQPTQSNQTLIIADRFDPNMRAQVGTIETKVENLNGMRAIEVPKGTNYIKVWYSPVWFWRSVWITLIASILAIGYLTKNKQQLSSLLK